MPVEAFFLLRGLYEHPSVGCSRKGGPSVHESLWASGPLGFEHLFRTGWALQFSAVPCSNPGDEACSLLRAR
jgi:hypothetical protein